MLDLGHAFFAPAGLPRDRLAALRDAFRASTPAALVSVTPRSSEEKTPP
ncbi:hypothetical protein ACFZAM_13145 [Streptomyces sp. NPDC008079]